MYHSSDGKLTSSGDRAAPLSDFLLPLSGNPQFPSCLHSSSPTDGTHGLHPMTTLQRAEAPDHVLLRWLHAGRGVSRVTWFPIFSPFWSPLHNVPSCPISHLGWSPDHTQILQMGAENHSVEQVPQKILDSLLRRVALDRPQELMGYRKGN